MTAVLHNGPAAEVLRQQIADGSIDMVYSDPPFGNRQVWKGKAGQFSDTWAPTSETEDGWRRLAMHDAGGAELMAMLARDRNARGYLGMMAALLLEVRRVLRPTGTLWLHFDDTMGAELQVLCDVVFGPVHRVGVVVWRRSTGHTSKRSFGRNHDSIACYGRTRVARWRLARLRSELVHGDPMTGVLVDGVLGDHLAATAKERVGYPTQKPVSLIERFIRAATLPGDVLLDPTCGSGTALVAAVGLGRWAIGADISADAIAVARARLGSRAPRQVDLFVRAA